MSDVRSLRSKLADPKSPDYILKEADPKNIPFDSLFAYMKEIWEIIEENKDIDIPN